MSNECYCIAARVLSMVWHALPAEHLHWNITAFKDDTACDTFASADWFLNVKPWERVQMISNVLYTKSSINKILQDDRSTPMTPSRFLLIPTNHLQTNTLIIMHCLDLRSSSKLPPSRHFQTAERIANVDVWILPPIPAHLRYQRISGTSTPSP